MSDGRIKKSSTPPEVSVLRPSTSTIARPNSTGTSPPTPGSGSSTPSSGTPTLARRQIHKALTLAATSPVGDKSFLELATEVSSGNSLLPKPAGEAERVVHSAELPESRPLSSAMLWGDRGKPNLSILRKHLAREGRLELDAALQLVRSARDIFRSEPNILELSVPLLIFGDIHGQFYDLLNILDKTKAPGSAHSTPTPSPQVSHSGSRKSSLSGETAAAMAAAAAAITGPTRKGSMSSEASSATATAAAAMAELQLQRQFLFLGDYVDRGDFSTEVLFYLLAMKVCFPLNVWLLRGNHETRMMAEFMTFRLEIDHKYASEDLYVACVELFDSLPLAAMISGSRLGTFLAVHGGIGPDIASVDDIAAIDRFQEPPPSGPLCDLLWSDPVEPPDGWETFSRYEIDAWKSIDYVPNTLRQTSFMYGLAALRGFLDTNGVACLIRAHQVVDDGFKEHRYMTTRKLPYAITIFSAPNYTDMYGNKGAVISLTASGLEFEQFEPSPHPFYLPDFSDVLSWSLPYLMESLVSMLSELVIAIKEENATQESVERKRRDQVLAEKMRMMRIRLLDYEQKQTKMAKIRQELLKVDHPNFERFKRATQLDAKNEQCPIAKRPVRRPLERTSSWVW